MKLLESVWDGNIEGVRYLLNRSVPVDVAVLVRSMKMVILAHSYTNIILSTGWADSTTDGISEWIC